MKKIRLLTLMLISTMLFTSCGTLFRPKMTFTSNKPTADVVKVDNQTYTNVTFPLKVKAKAKVGTTHVTATNKDCKPVNFDIEKKFNSVCLLNIPFGGIGLIIDLACGGNTKPKQRTYYIEFEDKNSKNDGKDEIQNNYIVQNNNQQKPAVPIPTSTSEIKSDVDNAPTTGTKSPNTFVLIIANEHYSFVDNVDFAIHDGEVFREYCIKTMGVPERQVWFYKNATGGIIAGGVDKMVQAMSLFENSKAIVYYCGHGIPDEHTGDAYIVPTDGNGKNIATCYSLNKLYTTLASSNATSVTYFMDACFSGANKEGSMLVAARGVAREAKKEKLNGNTVVFSAASGDETAMTYKEKGHGLFTYFLLKKLQETKGDVSYEELDKYIKENVKRESFLTNEKVQTPTTNVSENAINNWKTMKLK